MVKNIVVVNDLFETWWIVNSTVYRGRQMGEEEEGEMKSSNREEKS